MIDVRAPAYRLRDFIVDHWETRGWPLPVNTANQYATYVAPGAMSAIAARTDGESLVVAFAGLAPGPATPRAGVPARGTGSVVMPAATYEIRLLRCVPEDDVEPPLAVLEDTGVWSWDDVSRLFDTLCAWCSTEPIGVSRNGPRQIGRIEPIGPQGGLVGVTASVSVSPPQ